MALDGDLSQLEQLDLTSSNRRTVPIEFFARPLYGESGIPGTWQPVVNTWFGRLADAGIDAGIDPPLHEQIGRNANRGEDEWHRMSVALR
jgi:hypothetical protein